MRLALRPLSCRVGFCTKQNRNGYTGASFGLVDGNKPLTKVVTHLADPTDRVLEAWLVEGLVDYRLGWVKTWWVEGLVV